MYEAGMMELRDYQQVAVDKSMDYYRGGGKGGLLVLPTGAGKTRIATEISRLLLNEEIASRPRIEVRPVVLTAHRDTLIQQLVSSVNRDIPGVSVGIEMAAQKATRRNLVIAASIPTIGRLGSNRMQFVEESGTSLFFIDEAHHAAANGYVYAADKYAGKDGLKLGVTATNHRLDQKQVVRPDGSALFDTVIHELTLLDGMRGKWLCPVRAFRVVTTTDISNVGNVAGDFNQKALEKAVDNEKRTTEAIGRWEEVAVNRKTLVFCVSIKHAEHSAAAWKKKGYAFEVVHSQQSEELNELYIGRLKRGEIQGICNVGVLTEGFDCPDISCIVQLRPTQSWTLYCQTIGRGTRNALGKKDCIVLDVVDNTTKHEVLSAPKVVGLDVDIEGETLENAVDVAEKARKEGRKRPEKPKYLKEIKTAAVEIDLFKQAQLAPEVNRLSKIAWQKIPSGYVVYTGDDTSGTPESVTVYMDSLGHWRVRVDGKGGMTKLAASYGQADIPAWSKIETSIRWLFERQPEKLNFIFRKKGATVTNEQSSYLLSKGMFPAHSLKNLSQEEAQSLMQKVIAGYRYPK